MYVTLKSLSIPVVVALLLCIGTVGGCTGLRGVSSSTILTNHHFTATRRRDAGDDSQERRFAASGRTQNYQELTLIDCEIDRVEHSIRAIKALDQRFYF